MSATLFFDFLNFFASFRLFLVFFEGRGAFFLVFRWRQSVCSLVFGAFCNGLVVVLADCVGFLEAVFLDLLSGEGSLMELQKSEEESEFVGAASDSLRLREGNWGRQFSKGGESF